MKEIVETILGWTIIVLIIKYTIKITKKILKIIKNKINIENIKYNNLTKYIANQIKTNNIENIIETKKQELNINKTKKITNENTKTYNTYFYKRGKLLTNNELKFYKILKEITKNYNYNIFTQVVLYEIVRNKEIMDFNKIKSKSIDFVVTDENSKILVCIELDDNTHNRKKRIERDTFINELFKDLNIKLLRIPVKEYYNIQEMEKIIITKINE